MSDSLQQLKAELAAAAQAPAGYPEGRFAGRGIVVCAGGARLFTCAWVLIALLRRHLGCTLPIEVWHLGAQELGPPMRGLLEELGAEPIDALAVARRHGAARLGGWELKPYALLHSRFREVLLLDADNVPVRDPAFLFDCPEYRDSGALFWPDRVRLAPGNAAWALGGLAWRDMPSFESGQLVLDKARCWHALGLVQWMNQRSEVFYRLLHGDKDTFLLAWLMLAQPFHLIRHGPKTLEATLCQRGPDGAVLFQHRNQAKWILDGDNPAVAGFRLERECRALLAELATRWDGRVFNPPPRSAEARRIEAELAGAGAVTLRRVSSDERQIALLPDHRVRSAVGGERYWHVADGVDGPELRIEGHGVPACALRRSADGVWRGRLLQPPGMPVELAAMAPAAIADPAPAAVPAALLEQVLELGAALPWDDVAARDVVGTLRILAALDPAVVEQLSAQQPRWPAASPRGRVIAAALDALHGASGGAPAPGHGWLDTRFALGDRYLPA